MDATPARARGRRLGIRALLPAGRGDLRSGPPLPRPLQATERRRGYPRRLRRASRPAARMRKVRDAGRR